MLEASNRQGFEHSVLGFVNCLGFRASDFGLRVFSDVNIFNQSFRGLLNVTR